MSLSIFSNPSIIHLLEIFFWMLGAFLIGLFFGKIKAYRKKNSKPHNSDKYVDLNIKDDLSKIRATKTFERGGKKMIKTIPIDTYDRGLNFNRIGFASIENKDNLKKIKGIGPSIEKKLNAIGIFTFEQISNFNSRDIAKITELIKFFAGRIERDDWVGQAFKLINESKN
ncbi:hypothetical protein Lupro_00730 [Lutibacter profundi]|uniref:NADH dehydrogenase n=1 Tax=Lutibacter profundi TaxID=1622118 RepID=A0A0X8G4I4_9FLAO|nr:hypothetical protein [Lutibacter profundi]AMC09875.1 hypothetical protein Lupro_00730 [Lutibacter profundi]